VGSALDEALAEARRPRPLAFVRKDRSSEARRHGYILEPCSCQTAIFARSIEAGRIGLDPLNLELIQPSSIDVRLDRFFRLFDNHKYAYIDPREEQPDLTRVVEVAADEPFVLHPGEFVLGSTWEVVSLPDDIAARVEGKSSLGRLGLLTHATAGFVDPGFTGHVTLELSNVATLPVTLWPGMKIGQLCFIKMSSPSEHPYGSSVYGSRYQNQRGPTPSRSFKNFHVTDVS